MSQSGAQEEEPVAILVLGVHRSGTSALTRFIGQLGAALPNDPLPGAGDNPAGFWEPLRVIGQNETVLHALGSTWFDTTPLDFARLAPDRVDELQQSLAAALFASFDGAPRFVVKDPRICRMVPFYREVLAGLGVQPRAVLILRDPREVAASLAARNQISSGYAALLWAHNVVEAERQTRRMPRLVLSFDDLLTEPARIAECISRLLGRDMPAGVDLAATLRPDLRHRTTAAFGPALAPPLEALYAATLALRTQDDVEHRALIDAASSGFLRVTAPLQDLAAAEYAFHRLTIEDPRRRRPEIVAQRHAFAAAMERLISVSART